jgi:hypothetical protein
MCTYDLVEGIVMNCSEQYGKRLAELTCQGIVYGAIRADLDLTRATVLLIGLSTM